MMNKNVLVAFSCLFLIGCETFTAERYFPSATNTNVLKSASQSYNVGSVVFTSPESLSIGCRLAGPIKVPGNSYENYIKKALTEELAAANKLNTNSNSVINTKISELTLSSVTPASWKIAGDVYVNDRLLENVSTNYEFSTSFTALQACRNAAENLPYALETFIADFSNKL